MSIEQHVAATEKHLQKIVSGADEQAETDAAEAYRKELVEAEPTAEDFEKNRLLDVERKFIHEQTAHNIFRTLEDNDPHGKNKLSWYWKKDMLRNALRELDASLAIEETEIELSFRKKIVEQLADMDRFMTERHLTGAINELLDSSGAYQLVMKEAWEATLANPEAMEAVNGEWLRLYSQAESALIDAAKQEKNRKLSLEEERTWLLFILRKLDGAQSIMPDKIADDMRRFALKKLREIAEEAH